MPSHTMSWHALFCPCLSYSHQTQITLSSLLSYLSYRSHSHSLITGVRQSSAWCLPGREQRGQSAAALSFKSLRSSVRPRWPRHQRQCTWLPKELNTLWHAVQRITRKDLGPRHFQIPAGSQRARVLRSSQEGSTVRWAVTPPHPSTSPMQS